MVHLSYEILGDSERGVEIIGRCSAFFPCEKIPNCRGDFDPRTDIEKLFPFQGKFHFRVKVPEARIFSNQSKGNASKQSYVWVDVTSKENMLSDYVNGLDNLEVRALALETPELSDEELRQAELDYNAYINATNEALEHQNGGRVLERRHRKMDHASSADDDVAASAIAAAGRSFQMAASAGTEMFKQLKQSTQDGTAVQAMTKGVSSLWSSMVTTASQLQQTIIASTGVGGPPSVLSDQGAENLGQLADDVSQQCSEDQVVILQTCWTSLFGSASFERQSNKWKEAGWQTQDPASELKNSGVLALKALTYMCTHHADRAHHMMERNKANTKRNYPFAIVAVNITLLLVEALSIRDSKLDYFINVINCSLSIDLFALCLFSDICRRSALTGNSSMTKTLFMRFVWQWQWQQHDGGDADEL